MDKNKDYMTRSALSDRGWTLGMIKKYLGEPDQTRPNPYYKCAAPMALYSVKRVDKVEKSEVFLKVLEKSKGRKEAARKAVDTKRDKAIDYVKSLDIVIPEVEFEGLVREACYSYNDYHEWLWIERGHDYTSADPRESDKEFLARITINHIRHNHTSYEDELFRLYGKTGVKEAHDILQNRINNAIMEKYPQLKMKNW